MTWPKCDLIHDEKEKREREERVRVGGREREGKRERRGRGERERSVREGEKGAERSSNDLPHGDDTPIWIAVASFRRRKYYKRHNQDDAFDHLCGCELN